MILKTQLVSLFFSFLSGIVFCIFTKINYRFLFLGKKITRIIFNVVFVVDYSLLYFIILSKINGGILHIYFLLLFIFGFFIAYFILYKRTSR